MQSMEQLNTTKVKIVPLGGPDCRLHCMGWIGKMITDNCNGPDKDKVLWTHVSTVTKNLVVAYQTRYPPLTLTMCSLL